MTFFFHLDNNMLNTVGHYNLDLDSQVAVAIYNIDLNSKKQHLICTKSFFIFYFHC